jgi:hypothetical protein
MERSMKRIFWTYLLFAAALLVPSCGSQKSAAEAAMAQTVTAYNAIKEQAANIAPDDAKAIDDGIAAATAQLQAGDYKGALAAATSLGARVKELADSLPDKTTQLQSAWTELAGSLPGTISTLEKRTAGLKMPAAGTPNAEQSPMVVLAGIKTGWTDAQSAAQAGRLAEAVSKGNDVRSSAVKLLTDLQGGS